MASVQELIAAAEAQKSPFISMLEGVAGGYYNAQQRRPENDLRRVQMMAQMQEMEQKKQEMEWQKMLNTAAEQNLRNSLLSAAPDNGGPLPKQKLKSVYEYGPKGASLKFVEPETGFNDAELKQARLDLIKAQTDAVQYRREVSGKTFDANMSNKLRQEFINRPEVKDYISVATNVKSMDSLLNKALSGDEKSRLAIDQGLITIYNKISDPTSVVRESEYARTPENAPTINRIAGAIAKVKAGGAGITNEDRKALVTGAKILANERGATFQNRRDEYRNIANLSGADPILVVGTIPDFTPYDLGGGTVQVDAGGVKIGTVEDGYRFKGGDPANSENWEKVK